MVRLVRSPRAKRDIADVLRYTRERWGDDQAVKYRELIRRALQAIGTDPECGTRRFTTLPGVLAYHIARPGQKARHLFFYRVAPGGEIEIIRFLHDSMDFVRHLP